MDFINDTPYNLNSGTPIELTCILTKKLYEDPVIAADGHTYERKDIERWIQKDPVSPVTSLLLKNTDLTPNFHIQRLIQEYKQQSSSAAATPKSKAASDSKIKKESVNETPALLIQQAELYRKLGPIHDKIIPILDNSKPPMLITIGECGSAKSSLLKRITGISLFPKSDGRLCTRMPILISLRFGERLAPKIRITNNNEEVEHETTFHSTDSEKVVRDLMNAAIKQENLRVSGISRTKRLEVHLSGPHLPNLKVLDLPGVVLNPDDDDPATMCEDTHALVDEYIARYKEDAIFLALREISDKTKSSQVVQILKRNSDILDRTLGVFTKCDRSNKMVIEEKLENPGVHLGYGYVATMSDPSAPSLREQMLNEKTFFKGEGMEDLMQSGKATCDCLVKILNDICSVKFHSDWASKTLQFLKEKQKTFQQRDRSMGLPRAHEDVPDHLLDRVAEITSKVLAKARDTQVDSLTKNHLIPLKRSMEEVMESVSKGWTSIQNYELYYEGAVNKMTELVMNAADQMMESMAHDVRDQLASDTSPVRVSRFPKFVEAVVNEISSWGASLVLAMKQEATDRLKRECKRMLWPDLNLEEGKARVMVLVPKRVVDVVCQHMLSFSLSSAMDLDSTSVKTLADNHVCVENCREDRLLLIRLMEEAQNLLIDMELRLLPSKEEKVLRNGMVALRSGMAELDLRGISDKGARVLCLLIPRYPGLTKLAVRNTISLEVVASIVSALGDRKSSHKVNVSLWGVKDGSVLHQACKDGRKDVVLGMLRIEGVDLNQTEDARETAVNQCTPLWVACRYGHLDVVRALLNWDGIAINRAASDDGTTPLFIACRFGHVEVVKELLSSKGVNILQADESGATPLNIACQHGHVGIAKALLDTEMFNVNETNGHGETLLWTACCSGNTEMVRLLLSQPDLDVNMTTPNGTSPLSVAREKGGTAIIQLLKEAGAMD